MITGATGAIGPSVVDAFAPRFDIRTLSRHPPAADLFQVPVTSFTGDICDTVQLRRAAAGSRVIVHLAALLHIVDPPETARPEYERVNVAGTAAVIDAAKAEGIPRVVHLSTIAVYGSQPGVRLDEESATCPDTFYGETKLAAERVALNARASDGRPFATVLRAAAVYGPRVKGNYVRLVQALARHRFVPIGPGDNLRTLVFERDLAASVFHAAIHPDAGGRTYNVTDGQPHPLRDIIATICAALGRRPPRWHFPISPARAALRAGSIINRRLPAMLDKYLEEVAVDSTRIQCELGFRPETGLVEGWAATIAAMKRKGAI